MKEFDRLVEIIEILRGENGCPWDREQTLESLKPCLREETAELLEAMESGNIDEHRGELGDVLLQVVFQANIQKENGNFTINDVLEEISEKLIRRHPHIFKEKIEGITTDEVLKNWDIIKKTEKIHKDRKSVLDGIPKYLPALSKAQKIQKKASKVGFDWENIDGVFSKIYEELEELKTEIKENNTENIEEELGDLLFSVVNLARFVKVDSTEALEKTIKKFDRRFRFVEERCSIEKSTVDEMEKLWNLAKEEEKDEIR